MKENNIVMTFDIGTQSVRVSLFNSNGTMLAYEKEEYEEPYFSSKDGYAEQEADFYYECLKKACNRLAINRAELVKKVRGITLSCFRDSAVLLDKNLKPLRPIILWLDQRTAKCEKKLPLLSRAIFKAIGKTETIELNRRRTASNWIIENEKETWEKVYKYVSLSTYLFYLLTGNLVDCASDYAGHFPIDYKNRKWNKDPLNHIQGQVFSISKDKLCDLVEPLGKIGEINKKASESLQIPVKIPVFAAGSDKSCETLGCGIIDNKMLSISLGTACTVETTTSKYIGPLRFLPAYPSVLPDDYNMDLQVYRGFWMINWYKKEFGFDKNNELGFEDINVLDLDNQLASIEVGSGGLITQPFWGSQLDKPEVRGSIIGFNGSTTKYHIYRSIVEGILFELKFGAESFSKRLHHHKFEKIRIAGGGAGSSVICQLVADMFGLEVERVQTFETSSLGAATACYIALGEFKNKEEAIQNMIHVSDKFIPNKENNEKYNRLFNEVYLKLYPSLKKNYRYLFRLNK